MKVITDAKGNEWLVSLTVASIERVKEGAEFDLCSLILGPPLEKFYNDLSLVIDCLYWLCKPLADDKQISQSEFKEKLFFGDFIEAAQNAILDELPAFFPTRRKEVMEKLILEIRTNMERVITDLLATKSSTSATTSAGSSGSIPKA